MRSPQASTVCRLSRSGQGTVEYALVLAAFLALVIALGLFGGFSMQA